jgi:hypothetical protein
MPQHTSLIDAGSRRRAGGLRSLTAARGLAQDRLQARGGGPRRAARVAMAIQFIDEDFVAVRRAPDSDSDRAVTLVYGDPIELGAKQGVWRQVRVLSYFDGPFDGFVKGDPRLRATGVLGLSMVDVQQGDGLILQTPSGKTVFIDGGDNKLFARHAAARFRHRQTSASSPLEVDAIIITHGDADHFDGLNDLRRSETLTGDDARKRLFIHPRRVFHNGLVKSSEKDASGASIPDMRRFGRTVVQGGDLHVVDLFDDPRAAPPELQGGPFKRWNETLTHWEARGPIQFRRVAFGMNEGQLFGFLAEEGVGLELQGPIATTVADPATGQPLPALPFLHQPRRSAVIHLEQGSGQAGALSASHTINGHSIAFRLTFGNVRFAFTGDLNQEAMERMLQHLGPDALEAEIVKVPHHGSADFDFRAIQAMKPVVALVSSGDESVLKEHIHPRATLMASLGKSMRGDTGVVFLTELAAFFGMRSDCLARADVAEFFRARADQTFSGEQLRQLFTGKPQPEDPSGLFFGFERLNFGIIHLRTDGERVLVFTHSGRRFLNEAYRFTVRMHEGQRVIEFADEVETR